MIEPRPIRVHWSMPEGGDVSVLSEREADRASRFRRLEDRDRFVASHSWLRSVLGAELGRDPATLRFVEEGRGKPRLDGNEIDFSFSHSGDLAAVAVSCSGPVGVDVELPAAGAYEPRAAGLVLSVEELREIELADDPDRAFLQAWTRKEAFSKVSGQGLDERLRDLTLRPGEVREGSRIVDIEIAGAVAAVAVPEGAKVEVTRC